MPYVLLNTPGATLLGYVTLALPLVVLLQLFSLIFIDRTLVEAAHNMRCGRLRTVFEVVVPSARVGLVIAGLFAFILSFGDFVSPIYLGGGDARRRQPALARPCNRGSSHWKCHCAGSFGTSASRLAPYREAGSNSVSANWRQAIRCWRRPPNPCCARDRRCGESWRALNAMSANSPKRIRSVVG